MAALSLAEWLEIIKGVLAFPGAVLQLVRVFRTLPADKQANLDKEVEAIAVKLQETGRPTWEE